jgi:hypothetical protein
MTQIRSEGEWWAKQSEKDETKFTFYLHKWKGDMKIATFTIGQEEAGSLVKRLNEFY